MPWPEELPLNKTTIGTVDTFEDAQEFMRWLGEKRDVLAFDTETTGIDPYAANSRIRLAQFGDVNGGWVIDAERWPGLVREVLETYTGEIALHNCAFDYKWLAVQMPGIQLPWSHTHDTMIAHRLHDNEAPAGLKPVSEKIFGSAATAGSRMLDATFENTGTDWETVPMDAPAYRVYSGVDVILTARLYRRMSHVISGQFKSAYDLEMQARRICTNMELKGMRIDPEYCKQKRDQLAEYVEKTMEWGLKKYGIKLSSSRQLGQWFKDNSIPILEWTGSGFPKMDEENLLAYAKQGHEIADITLKARKADKIVGTYLDNFIRYSENSGDIVHPNINTIAARTGRMSITQPALQTLSRTETTVRGCFIPHGDNEMLLSADSDQIEFRYIAALCGDPGLKAAFNQADSIGPDVFTQIGQEIFDDPDMVKKDPRRDTVKTLIYARNYGAGIAKQAQSAGIPEARMREISKAFDERYPGLNRFNRELISTMETMARSGERPYVTTHTGRRLYIDPGSTYRAGNYLVQGACAEVLKESLVNLDMSGLSSLMCVPVHDEVLFSIPKECDVTEIRETISECMTNTDFSVPLPAECGHPMERWAKQ
ncbi:DNA polymerase I [Gordonia phage GodonK]|uniref:DNA polymerase I n=1 Tax=Gordonia phage GodonK TaxID=2562192 RepID=A0A4D6E2E4_9CAUD|nr:DNA polymerase I [Gordonia phage GodonK]QBZ72776.1 DNA polymerase I [Gordonia phage GodonK]